MDLTQDSPCIIGTACRLPGGVKRPDVLWPVFNNGDWQRCSTIPPPSRGFPSNARVTGRGGWLSEEGVERFDPHFFGISDAEAVTLRPNIRLALELTYEALEHAGIAPALLRGKNVSVSVGVGTEDGWDMKRWRDDGVNAFDAHWAQNSDPSGVPGHIAHVFNFRGTCNTVSNACASGAFALRDGIHSLYHDGAEVAIVGSLATHFSAAPFGWAVSAGVASRIGRSSAFSPDADGYSPSEGAVFFVLKRQSAAQRDGDPIYGIIRALASGHNGAMRTLITPNSPAQAALSRDVLKAAGLEPGQVTLLEAHGTGTPVGDALEVEGIRSVHGKRDDNPLILSSAKTVLGHCHGAAAQVGILKVLGCFEHDMVPPHHAKPHAELRKGSIIIPVDPIPLKGDRLIGQVNAFGFTGSIASIIIEKYPPQQPSPPPSSSTPSYYLLPFSAKSPASLSAQIRTVCAWALETKCPLRTLSAVLSLCRDHHPHRRAFVTNTLEALADLNSDTPVQDTAHGSVPPNVDNATSLELLNLDKLDPLTFDEPFRRGPLAYLLKENRVLEAACILYERGHALSFERVHDKRDIEPKIFGTFPFYQFERKRCWKDSPLTPPLTPEPHEESPVKADGVTAGKPASGSQRPSSSVSQEEFEELINAYGAPIDVTLVHKLAPAGQTPSHFLLTGASGMLGAQVLTRLLATPSHTVYCIVRGEDPLSRLCAAFSTHHLDVQQLHSALARGALHVLPTSDLCAPKLGLSPQDYTALTHAIDTIIHAAWPVDFNLPLDAFRPFLQCTRVLAELCHVARKRVRYHYIGSYASTFNYKGEVVPEGVIEPRVADSLVQGYAISKLVAEHSLLRLHRTHGSLVTRPAFDLSIVRVGQICGESTTGAWSQKEMMPMMMASLPALRVFPRSMPAVTWIPSDVCADALRDIVVSSLGGGGVEGRQVIHLANPHRTPWPDVACRIGELAGIGAPELVPFSDYVDRIKRHKSFLPITPLLPYFVSSLEEGTMPEQYASLEVSSSLKYSASLEACPPIASELLTLIVRESLKGRRAQGTVAASPVFLFGPWSALASAAADSSKLMVVETRVMTLAEQIRSSLGDIMDGLDPDLEQQLKTLALQLTTVQTLTDQGIVPGAVLGYCFGEYAAAITAGILSEETAIEILVRRAIVLRGVKGAMLNAFCDLPTARRTLACLVSPPDIATVIGPKHIVLSGSMSQIKCGETELTRRGIKTLPVATSLPFHSSLMESPTIQFSPLSYTPRATSICYISGITGGPLPGSRLGTKYWLRHMRDSLDFYRAMQYVRKAFAGEYIIDIGPGVALTKMIARYEWSDVLGITPEEGIARCKASLSLRRPRQPQPLSQPPLPSSTTPQGTHTASDAPLDPVNVALELLGELFGYKPSSELLSRSLHSVGLQSMDFIRFAERFSETTGIQITLSAFVSDTPLKAIIDGAEEA